MLVLLAACVEANAMPANTRKDPAKEVLAESIAAMGGESALRGIRSIQFTEMLDRNALEQSERPEGPYIAQYQQISEWRDLAGCRVKLAHQDQFAMYKFAGTTIVAGGVAARGTGNHFMPGGAQDLVDAEESFELSPERILLTALEAHDLRLLPDVVLQSVKQHVLAFTWRKHTVRIFLNSETLLPTAVEWTRAYPAHTYWNLWGDVTTRVYYSLWWLAEGDVRYPLQLDFVRNGLPDRKVTITDIRINPLLADDLFAIPEETKTAFREHPPVLLDERPLRVADAQELAKDVIFLPGSWNIAVVKQTDGIVIIEAPISSGYSAQAIAEAKRRYPGVPVKAVISTSDSWPHVGGVREYAARGIPIYALDRNLPLLNRIVAAPHHERPDALTRGPKAAKFVSVSAKTVIGTGPNRLEIYPIHGDTSERQMMVYFPELRLLYGSDPFQKNGDQAPGTGGGTYTYPQTVSELRDAVAREHLPVERFFMMHIGPTSWSELQDIHGGPIPPS